MMLSPCGALSWSFAAILLNPCGSLDQPRGRVSFGIAPVIVSLLIVDAEHFEAPAQSDCPVNPVQHHIFIAHIEGGDGFRSIRIDDEERRQLTLVGKAHYRELSVVRHFGGLDRSEEHTSELSH